MKDLISTEVLLLNHLVNLVGAADLPHCFKHLSPLFGVYTRQQKLLYRSHHYYKLLPTKFQMNQT